VTNDPHKYSFEENPFILYKRKGSTDYYLGGWVLYREIHASDEIERPTPKVAPACNYVRSEEPSVESSTPVSHKVVDSYPSGGSSQNFSGTKVGESSTTNAPTGECEVFVIGSLPKKGYYVDTFDEFVETVKALARAGINSYKRPEDNEPVPIFLKKSVFSKEDTEKIKKQLKVELGIKMKIAGYPGRPCKSDDYRKIREITW